MKIKISLLIILVILLFSNASVSAKKETENVKIQKRNVIPNAPNKREVVTEPINSNTNPIPNPNSNPLESGGGLNQQQQTIASDPSSPSVQTPVAEPSKATEAPAPVTSAPVISEPLPTTAEAPTNTSASPSKDDSSKPTTTDPDDEQGGGDDDGNNRNDDNINGNDNNNTNDDGEGTSGSTIGIVIGIVAASLIIVILAVYTARKLSNRRKYDEPIPINSIISPAMSNSNSTTRLNTEVQDPAVYQNSTPTEYYAPPGPVVAGAGAGAAAVVGMDITNGNNNGGGNGGGGMTNDYSIPPQQEQVFQPARQHSSLRRPKRNTTTMGMGVGVGMGGMENATDYMENGQDDLSQQQAGMNKPGNIIINKSNNTPIEPGTIHKTMFSFEPNMEDELRLNTGDAVEIIEVYDDGWSYGKNVATNEVGVFPISYITGYNDPSHNF